MRWIEEAVQKGRDYSNTDDSLLSVATIRKGIAKAKARRAQQQLDTERRREKEGTPAGSTLSITFSLASVFISIVFVAITCSLFNVIAIAYSFLYNVHALATMCLYKQALLGLVHNMTMELTYVH